MFRDEADVAFHTLMHLGEEGLDGIVVADNMSTDATRSELERAQTELAGRCEVVIVDDGEPGYFQSSKMTHLAAMAVQRRGATWIVPFDADEIWYTRGDRLGIVLGELPAYVGVVEAPLFNHFPSSIDPDEAIPFRAIEWRQRLPGALPKVAFRWSDEAVIGQGNHSVVTLGAVVADTSVELRHFPYRSFEQFVRKARNGAAAYAATDLPESEGAHWRSYGQILDLHGEEGLRQVYERWFSFLSPVDAGLIHDPAPFRRWRNT